MLDRMRRYAGCRHHLYSSVSSGGGGGFTPASFGTNLRGWWKADAGTTTVTNGSSLTSWTDQSTAANDLSNVGTPKFVSSTSTNALNSLPVMDLTGSNTGWSATTVTTWSNSTVAAFAVRKSVGYLGSATRIFSVYDTTAGNDNGQTAGAFMTFPDSPDFLVQRNGNTLGTTGVITDNAWSMVGFCLTPGSSASHTWSSNGTGALTQRASATDSNGAFCTSPKLLVNSHSPSNGDTNAYLAEMFVLNTAPSTSDVDNIYSYFNTRWGVT